MPDRPHRLSPHASHIPLGVSVSASVTRQEDGGLALDYRASAPAGALRVPLLRLAAPADQLWQHTCFELFVAVAGASAYREFNFSPSRQWAVYDFDAYRQPSDTAPPRWSADLRVDPQEDGVTLRVTIPPPLLPDESSALQIGLSAVLEHAGEALSYWALRHPAAKPDFHHREGFSLMLPAACRA
ncbi:MAG: DOMON-like domain-containing protein [Rhodocyclaceae bacterium]|nr:DOMON-like domain-containing protein [Rhodocyclaceae bacterium]